MLNDISGLLASTQDFDSTLRRMSQLAVERFATWCAIDRVDEDGRIIRVAVSHFDPKREMLAHEVLEKYPPRPWAQRGVYRVIANRQPILISRLTREDWAQRAESEEHLDLIMRLGSTSYMCVPLLRDGRAVGSMMLLSESREYGVEDLREAETLAESFAVAVDNASAFLRLRAEIREREELITIAAHELRTPLTPLALQAGMVRKVLEKAENGELTGADLGRIRQFADITERQVLRLSRLIETLLDVSRLDAGRMHLKLESLSLATLVREAVNRYQAEARRTGTVIEFEATTEFMGFWDRLRIEQVLDNLISNALKYGCGKPVRLRIEESDGSVVLHVEDQGQGIAAEDRERVFGRFERLDGPSTQQGLGLGLYITREIVKQHGGNIRVESGAVAGSDFVVELPRGAG